MSDQPPAGWYPDLKLAGMHRWWDGQTWTEQVQPSHAISAMDDQNPIANRPATPTFNGAGVVAGIFQAASLVVLIAGLAATYELERHMKANLDSSSLITGVVVGSLVGTILSTAAFAFFGYVLTLLRAIHDRLSE